MAQAEETPAGCRWPPYPEGIGSMDLFYGNPGVVLFLLECHHVTGDSSCLNAARDGANELLEHIEEESQPGLYVGLSGMGSALLETFRASADERYRDGVMRCITSLATKAREAGGGLEWLSPPIVGRDSEWHPNDIIFGTAGIGLFLMAAAEALQEPGALELAEAGGRRLFELAEQKPGGFDWALDKTHELRMPNFSHGTAGIVYFLASLAMATGDSSFSDAAVRGGSFLQSIALTDGRVAFVQHTDPPPAGAHDHPDITYLTTWSQGPIGTGWTWFRLYQATGDERWLDWLERSGRAMIPSEAPADFESKVKRVPPNFYTWWAGPPAEGNFFLDVHRATGDDQYLKLAIERMEDTLAHATREEGGIWWANKSDFGDKPRWTGLMQGASGVGLLLLYLDGFLTGRKPQVILPDHPFPISI